MGVCKGKGAESDYVYAEGVSGGRPSDLQPVAWIGQRRTSADVSEVPCSSLRRPKVGKALGTTLASLVGQRVNDADNNCQAAASGAEAYPLCRAHRHRNASLHHRLPEIQVHYILRYPLIASST